MSGLGLAASGCLLVILTQVTGATAVSSSDIYTSSAQVQLLVNSERSLLRMLKAHFETQADTDDRYHSFLRDVERDLQALRNVTSVSHPIDAFLGIKRFHGYKSKYLPVISKQLSEAVSGMLSGAGLALPDSRDVDGALSSLLRLQATYGLTAQQVTAAATANMTASDMVQLARRAARWHSVAMTTDWLEAAAAISTKRKDLELVEDARSQLETGSQIEDKDNSKTTGSPLHEAQHFEEKFHTLCRKYRRGFPDGLPRNERGGLRCHYGRGAGLYHQRWRTEELSLSPFIALLHSAISTAEAEHLRDVAFSNLERAGTGRGALHDGRTSKVAWLYDVQSETVAKLSRRVAAMTGLRTDVRLHRTLAEPFQIVNYGIGGQYTPHYDYYDTKVRQEEYPAFSRGSGNRLATFMFYIGEVEEGGATVFPHLDLGVPPIANSALFWYNLLPDGSPDPRTLHGGCPVLLGQKWVANKWIHSVSGAVSQTCKASR